MSPTPPNFQPQVGDTSNGAQTGTYVPRSDFNPAMATLNQFGAPNNFFLGPHGPIFGGVVNPQPMFGPMAPMYIPGPMMGPAAFAGPGGGWVNGPNGRYWTGGQVPHWNNGWKVWGPTRAEYMSDMQKRADQRPQDMVPGDPDPWRMYEVQELDGNWTRRNRYTIDSGDIGAVRWYQRPDGTIFAKRLSEG